MRLRLELRPGELPAKGRDLFFALSESLRPFPELSEVLAKATHDLDVAPRLRQPVARELAVRLHDAYQHQLGRMAWDIGKVLDAAAGSQVTKSAGLEQDDALGGDWVEVPEDVALLLMGDLDKARVPKYLRRVFNPKPPPKYRYFYNLTGGGGIGHQDEVQQGAAFAFEHQGQAGHYQVQKVEGDQVQVQHTATGHEMTTTKEGLRQHLRDHHAGKIRAAISQAAKHRAKKLREMFPEHAGEPEQQVAQEAPGRPQDAPKGKRPQEPAPAAEQPQAVEQAPPAKETAAPPKPAPKLGRVVMAGLGGKGGYDRIESVGLDAESLEAQAAAMGQDREYAVLDQGQSFALVSRPKGEPGRETVGGNTTVFLKNDTGHGLQALDAQWVVMEAADLIASHDPESFSPRQDYPEGVQERRYHDVKDEQLKVDRVARKMTPEFVANTNPDAVNGAPIVTERGVVLGGNGRTMGMQRAYALYPESADKLRAYLAGQAQAFGLSPSTVHGMKQPILVRRVQAGTDTDQLTRLGRRMNEALTQGLDPRAEEVAVSKFVTKDVVQSLTSHMDPEQTMSEFLHKGQSLPFVKDLERAGIIDAQNRAQFVDPDSGLLNEAGRSRILRVFAARMLPDAKLLESMDQSLRNNLAIAVPFLMTAEENGWDLREALHTAVRADQEMSAKNYPRDAKGRESFRRQMSLLGDKDTVRDQVQKGPAAVLLDIIQDHNGPQKLQRGFRAFAVEAAAQAHDYGQQASMFARPKVSQDQALARAFNLKAEGEGAAGGQTKLAASYASWEGDLVKAAGGGSAAGSEERDALFALTWEARRQVAAAVQSELRGHADLDHRAVVRRLEAFVRDLGEEDPGATKALAGVDLRQLVAGLARAQGIGKDSLQKAGGPFIGPRGGKWADPQHTIPWKEYQRVLPRADANTVSNVLVPDSDPYSDDGKTHYYHSSRSLIPKISEGKFGSFLFFEANEKSDHSGPYHYKVVLSDDDTVKAGSLFYRADAAKLQPLIAEVSAAWELDSDGAMGAIDGTLDVWKQWPDMDHEELAARSWATQLYAARAAKIFGYRGVAVDDEHGTVYMIDMDGHGSDLQLVGAPEGLHKSGGPFIGPRGGKWADAAHTIPWEEPGPGRAPAAPEEEAKPRAPAAPEEDAPAKPRSLGDLHADFKSLPEEEQHRRLFTDRNTGLLNARGADAQPHDPKRPMTARFSMEGFKAFNDRFGHEVPDGALRQMAKVLAEHMPDGVKRGGDLEGDVTDQAHADKIAEAMARTIDPEGRIRVVATAVQREDDHEATLADLGDKHREHKDAEVLSGKLGHRLKVPVAFGDHANPEAAMKPLADAMRAAPVKANATLGPHHQETFRKLGREKASKTIHQEDSGLLTEDGFTRSLDRHPDHHVASADLRGLQGINDAFGREKADVILAEFSKLVAENGGGGFNAAHPHGDEYLAHHEDPAKLQGFFSDLRKATDRVVFYHEKDTGGLPEIVLQQGLNFVHGVGRNLDEADRVDLAKNKARQGDVPPPRVLKADDADREIARFRSQGFRLVDLGASAQGGVRRGEGGAGGAGEGTDSGQGAGRQVAAVLKHPKVGDTLEVHYHPKTFGDREPATYHVAKVGAHEVQLTRHKDSVGADLVFGPIMPKESLKHFLNDQAGKVELPPSGNPVIDAVTSGKAKFLGKGDDGLAFRVGDRVVKVSTTVPYQPENPGHRSPAQAIAKLREQVEVGNRLADLGVAGIQRSQFAEHGDKGFQIKPWVEIPEKFTREQLDKIQGTLIGMHKHGYALHDDVQAGLDSKGAPVMFDVGKAEKRDTARDNDPIYSDIRSDMDNMRRLYEAHGEPFVRLDVDEGAQQWQRAENMIPGSPGLAARFLKTAAAKRREIAHATLKGKELDSQLGLIDFELKDLMYDVEHQAKKVKDAAPAKAPA